MSPGGRFIQFLICSATVDGLVAGAILYWRRSSSSDRPQPITLKRMLAAVLGAVIVIVIKLPIFRLQGLTIFGLLNLIYIDLVAVLPLLAISLLMPSARNRAVNQRLTRPAIIAACLTLLAIPVGIYATFIEPFRLQVETADISVSAERAGKSAFRIGVVADIQINHVTDYERGAIERLMAAKPDLIVIPGDVFQNSPAAFELEKKTLNDLFRRLDAPAGVFMVYGDVDTSPEIVRQIFEGTKVQVLFNETRRIAFADRSILIGGIELKFASEAAHRIVRELEESPGESDIRILLTHRPDVALNLKNHSRIDLVIAGHTHGGQVVIPFFGPPMTLSKVPRHVAAGGLHRINENPIYISRGVGCERAQTPRIRFLCPPEVSILTVGLEPKNR